MIFLSADSLATVANNVSNTPILAYIIGGIFYILLIMGFLGIIYFVYLGIRKLILGFISIFNPRKTKYNSKYAKFNAAQLKEDFEYSPYFVIKGIQYTGEHEKGWYFGKLEITPNNYDEYAIGIYYKNGKRIGYIPAENKELYKKMKKGMEVYGAIELASYWQRFHLFTDELPENLKIENFRMLHDMARHCVWSEGVKVENTDESFIKLKY